MNVLEELQEWYAAQCDGEWEHFYGVKIDTLDNPGWIVEIDLTGTSAQGLRMQFDEEWSEHEWVQGGASEGVFRGCGGPRDLTRVLRLFLEAVSKLD